MNAKYFLSYDLASQRDMVSAIVCCQRGEALFILGVGCARNAAWAKRKAIAHATSTVLDAATDPMFWQRFDVAAILNMKKGHNP